LKNNLLYTLRKTFFFIWWETKIFPLLSSSPDRRGGVGMRVEWGGVRRRGNRGWGKWERNWRYFTQE
jgi:hypothetical protein